VRNAEYVGDTGVKKSDISRILYELACRYYKGDGILQNYVKAYALSNAASAYGHENARALRDALAGKMMRREVSEAQHISAEYYSA
jgi:hypothetical protein